jgi:hypothetical protein
VHFSSQIEFSALRSLLTTLRLHTNFPRFRVSGLGRLSKLLWIERFLQWVYVAYTMLMHCRCCETLKELSYILLKFKKIPLQQSGLLGRLYKCLNLETFTHWTTINDLENNNWSRELETCHKLKTPHEWSLWKWFTNIHTEAFTHKQ